MKLNRKHLTLLGLQKGEPSPPSANLCYSRKTGGLSWSGEDREVSLDLSRWPVMTLDYLWYKGTEKGWGREYFRRLLANWVYLGATGILIPHAKGSPRSADEWNGYYTWPRFGFDGKAHWMTVRRWTDKRLATLARTSILDLFSIPEGREQWRKFGGPLRNLRFDLTPGSRSLCAWREYAGPEIPHARG